jgi:hypothetical protein
VREGEPSNEAELAQGCVALERGGPRPRGALSPRVGRTPPEGALSPRARWTLLEGAFRCAALVSRGGHQDRDRVVHVF